MTDSYYHIKHPSFEEAYFNIRLQEGRIYTDQEVAGLPVIAETHSYQKEWQMRKQSSGKLITYLAKKKVSLKILEPGCGNGWLCHRLAAIPGSQVTGLDINLAELQQARRVFRDIPDIQFFYGDLHLKTLKDIGFDTIILAACIQYFPSVPDLINDLFPLLKQDGEIHILDSPFYKPGTAGAARERTAAYYQKMGFPEMIAYYFHHEETVLDRFNCRALYQSSFFDFVFLNTKNPFPWFCIKKP